MSSDIHLFFGEPIATGQNVPVARYSMSVRVDWIDQNGVQHSETTEVLFPNLLAQIPPARLIEIMKDLIIERAQTVLGVNN